MQAFWECLGFPPESINENVSLCSCWCQGLGMQDLVGNVTMTTTVHAVLTLKSVSAVTENVPFAAIINCKTFSWTKT